MQPTDGWFAKRNYETWEQCEDEVHIVFKEKRDLENIDKERAYLSKAKNNSNKPKKYCL